MPEFGGTGSILAHDDALKDDWTPDQLPEREDEVAEIHYALEPASRGYTPNNAFIYGPAGQGKTVATKLKLNELEQYMENAPEIDATLNTFYVNCADLTSSYQVAGEILKEISPDMQERPRGYGLSNIFDSIFDQMENIGGTITIVLDEVDVIGDDDTVLYKLSRARSNDELDDVRLSLIGISNDFDFHSGLSQRVKDTLCEEEIRFSPYDANQLRDILQRRAEKGFKSGVLTGDVVPLCAAFAAQKNGSARQAITLLYNAGRLAQNTGSNEITEDHVRKARERLERDMLLEGLKDLTSQERATMLAVASLEAQNKTPARTKQVYTEYKQIATKVDMDISSMRSIRDHLQSLELYNFLNGEKRTGGTRGGERWVFELALDLRQMIEVQIGNRFTEPVEDIAGKAKKNGLL